jgi:hypothetical protein
MRLLHLYARSRNVPGTLVVAIGGAAGLWALDLSDIRLLVLAMALGIAVAASGLGGADVALDRTGSIPWPPRRAVHLIALTVVVAGLVMLVDPDAGPVILRDCAGLAGLAGLGAAVLGTQLAWSPPVVCTVCTVMIPPTNKAVTWLLQPAGTSEATLVAAVLGMIGLGAYAIFGSRS